VALRYGLDAASTERLIRLAGLDAEPMDLARRAALAVAVFAAALMGLGLVMWVAANWDLLGRLTQTFLLQVIVLTACAAALPLPKARPALALLALLAIGGLLAHIGQTYQTGADPWGLFAWWSLLGLPLVLAVRSDVLWTPWALVTLTAIALWESTHAGDASAQGLAVHALAWLAAVLVVVLLSPPLGRISRAGPWSLRTAATLAVALVTLTAVLGLFDGRVQPVYWLGLAVLGGAAAVLALTRIFDLGTLGATVLGLNTLGLAGLAHWILGDVRSRLGLIAPLLLLGLVAAVLLAASVAALRALSRWRGGGGS
jgi:uncharacterized membrane protein